MRRLMPPLLLLPLLAACAEDRTPVLPPDATANLQQAGSPIVVEVKFRPAPAAGAAGAALQGKARAVQAGAAAVLDGYGSWEMHRLVETAPPQRTAGAGQGTAEFAGEAPPDLSAWYQLVLPPGASAEEAAARLRALPEVEYAYPMPDPAPPPSTPDLSRLQDYFDAPTQGTAAFWAHNLPGGEGDGVAVVDIEFDWYLLHEDLLLSPATLISGDRYPAGGTDHGTAVLGMLVARRNGFGMTGGVPEALAMVASPMHGGFNRPAEAIAAATAATLPGDVILLELQTKGPKGEWVPLEWIQSVFEATRAATMAGRVVVAAAGNGGAKLDDTIYHGAFNRAVRNSGALLVGAGSSFHARVYFSNYGSRLDLQGQGYDVATTGYGDTWGTTPFDAYTRFFSGTSSAAPMVAAAAVAVQGRRRALGLPPMTAAQVAQLLRESGSPQRGLTGQNIGPFPDLYRALLSIRTIPTPPPALSAVAVSGTATAVTWVPATGHVNYVLQRRRRGTDGLFGPAETVASLWAVERGYRDTHLDPGGVYRYQVAACDAVRCSAWTYSPVVAMPVLPAAPLGLSGTLQSSTSIRLAWTDASANESEFRLWRRERPAGGEWTGWSQAAVTGRNVTGFTDAGRVPGTAYGYRVNACNLAGCSAGAHSGTLVAPVVPAAPGAVQLVPLSSSRVQVGWVDASGNETHFEVQRRLQSTDGATWGPLLPVGTARYNSVSLQDTVTVGRRYLYNVRACNGPACSPWATSPRLLVPVFPPAPGSFRVASAAVTGVRLAWTDGGTSETGFRLERRIRNAGATYTPWAYLATAPANATGFTDPAVVPGGRYRYRVSACNGTACSPWAPEASAAVPAS
jgi:serine protease